MILVTLLLALSWQAMAQSDVIDLAGEWSYRLDREQVGEAQEWYNDKFTTTLQLPGSLNTNNIGDDINIDTPWCGSVWNRVWYEADEYAQYRDRDNTKVVFWLTPNKYYSGQAWYQRTVNIPAKWTERSVELKLERCHWKTTLWVDGVKIGANNSLSTPHCYKLDNISSGIHTITIMVDNRVDDIDIGVDSHSISDNTQGNWNGIVGEMSLSSQPLSYISNIKIEPQFNKKEIVATLDIYAHVEEVANIDIQINPTNNHGADLPLVNRKVKLERGFNQVDIRCDMAANFQRWDEFSPNLYSLVASLKSSCGEDVHRERFGLRELTTKGTQILVNSRPVMLRGTLECCIFPKTGYPPTDKGEWCRIIKTCKQYGLNHIRFHSWTPPKAAFDVADSLGVYLYVECGSWSKDIGSGKSVDKFIYDESERIISEFGNHPSLCLFSYGNEPAGDNHEKYLANFINYWKAQDNRFLYTSAAGWPALNESDWHCLVQPRIQGWDENLKSVINALPPSSNYNWENKVTYDKPVVSHEIGQWCAYPDLKERVKYTGAYKAENFDIFEDRLQESGLLHLADSFLMASGKLQALCYKADIEAALRTSSLAGFQLLDLHDFPGQGSALVGVLNPFWESKGYISDKEYREFCNDVVPLAQMDKFIFRSGETLEAEVLVSQFSKADIKDATVKWSVVDSEDSILYSGDINCDCIATGSLNRIGCISQIIESEKAAQWQLRVEIGNYINRWNIWVYPKIDIDAKEVLITQSIDDKTISALASGGSVLLTPRKGSIKNEGADSVAVGFSSIFWNTMWTNGQAPHTLGILCDAHSPALRHFPTSYHSDYQWWDAMSHSSAIPLSRLGDDIKPIVRIIDDWFTARSLGLIIEVKVGKGKLLFCGVDLLEDAGNRLEAQQLIYSLLQYMQSDEFKPATDVDLDKLKNLLN